MNDHGSSVGESINPFQFLFLIHLPLSKRQKVGIPSVSKGINFEAMVDRFIGKMQGVFGTTLESDDHFVNADIAAWGPYLTTESGFFAPGT